MIFLAQTPGIYDLDRLELEHAAFSVYFSSVVCNFMNSILRKPQIIFPLSPDVPLYKVRRSRAPDYYFSPNIVTRLKLLKRQSALPV